MTKEIKTIKGAIRAITEELKPTYKKYEKMQQKLSTMGIASHIEHIFDTETKKYILRLVVSEEDVERVRAEAVNAMNEEENNK